MASPGSTEASTVSSATNLLTTTLDSDDVLLQALDDSIQQLQAAVGSVGMWMRSQASELLVKHFNNLTRKLNGMALVNTATDLLIAMSVAASKRVHHGSAT